MDNIESVQTITKNELDEDLQVFAHLILDKILDDQTNEERFFSKKQTK